MELFDYDTGDVITETYNTRMYITIIVTAIIANLIGAISNLVLFGFSIVTIACMSVFGLILIFTLFAYLTKRLYETVSIIFALVCIIEVPLLFVSYRLSAAPYMVLGAYAAILLFRGRARYIALSSVIIMYIVAVATSFVFTDLYNSQDNITLLISGLVSLVLSVSAVLTTLFFSLENFKHKIDENKELTQKLDRMNKYDTLTPSFNRKYIINYLYAQSAARTNNSISVVMFQLTDIIYINRKYGFHTGDEYLRIFVDICSNNLKNFGIISRFEGGRFIVVLNITNEQEVAKFAEEVCQANKERSIRDKKEDFNIAYGFSVCAPGFSVDDELKKCTEACYLMESKMKKKVVNFDEKK